MGAAMQLNSRFLFTGSAVLSLLFMVCGLWLLLLLPFFLMLLAVFYADREQIDEMDALTLAMLVPSQQHTWLSYEQFECGELLFYQAGCPVFRTLRAGKVSWVLSGAEGEADTDAESITLFPGFVYRRQR